MQSLQKKDVGNNAFGRLQDDNTVCIVGHGPSLVGAKKGKIIDRFKVCRLKESRGDLLNKDDYGEREDYRIATTETCSYLKHSRAKEFWLYPKKGSYDPKALSCLDGKKYSICMEVEPWNVVFRKIAGHVDGPKNRNLSIGIAAFIVVCEKIKPTNIVLAGFDIILSASPQYISVFNPGTTACSNHNWKCEREILNGALEKYDVNLFDIGGRQLYEAD